MSKWPAALVLAVILAGCSRLVEDTGARPEPAVAPIAAAQVGGLLSPKVQAREGMQFDKVEPDRCAPVAREVAAPFLTTRRPVAIDGGHWESEADAVVVEEIVAVYRADFDHRAALADARRTIESCRDTALAVTTVQGRTYMFRLGAAAPAPAPDDTVLWSLRGVGWNCDNALVAAHNAAMEITTCGVNGGFDVASAARDARARIEALANSTV